MTLEGVRLELAAGFEFLAPNVRLPVQSAARGEFEFRFRGQALAGPFRVNGGILPGDVHPGMIATSLQVARRTLRVLPACAFRVTPPSVSVGKCDRVRR